MKNLNIIVKNQTNNIVTLVGGDLGAVSVDKIESLIDFSTKEAKEIVKKAQEEQRYINYVMDDKKIKTIVVLTNGNVYPCSFNLNTMVKRIEQASSIVKDLESICEE